MGTTTKFDPPGLRIALSPRVTPLDKDRLGPDIVAGITLAALGIPEVMGYTKIIWNTRHHRTVHAVFAGAGVRDLRLLLSLVVGLSYSEGLTETSKSSPMNEGDYA